MSSDRAPGEYDLECTKCHQIKQVCCGELKPNYTCKCRDCCPVHKGTPFGVETTSAPEEDLKAKLDGAILDWAYEKTFRELAEEQVHIWVKAYFALEKEMEESLKLTKEAPTFTTNQIRAAYLSLVPPLPAGTPEETVALARRISEEFCQALLEKLRQEVSK